MPTTHYEKGPYKAKITGQRFGQTPSGTDFFALEIEPTSALGANTFPDTVHKREVTLWFSENAAPYSIDKLRRIGWEGTKLLNLDPQSKDFESLADIEVEVVCDYNDKGYEDWNLSAPGGTAKDSDKSVASRLDKLFGKAIKNGAPVKAKKPKQETVPPSGDDDDDIPF